MRNWLTICIAICVVTLYGCSETNAPTQETRRSVQPADQYKPSPWQITDGAARIAIASENDDIELADAVAKAQSTADEARKLWQSSTNEQRNQWAINWAARTVEGNIEYVWVKPILAWSKFRIEGKLANQPTTELACDKTLGQSVSFPIEELSDWVNMAAGVDAEAEPVRQGGFTMKLLEQRYGNPE